MHFFIYCWWKERLKVLEIYKIKEVESERINFLSASHLINF